MTPNLTQLRLAAREIFDETLRGVDAGAAIRHSVHLNRSELTVGDTTIDIGSRKIYSVAIGKAAFAMGYALEQALGESFKAGFLSGPNPAGLSGMPEWPRTRWRWRAGGHPLPNETSLLAATEGFDLLERANEERAVIIFLISGGGSAMLEWPINQNLTLEHLRLANKILVNCGASISEINAVRRTFSAVKGGRLAMRAPDCDQITLIVSDVPAGEERNVASGPTLTPPNDAPDALAVIDRYHLRAHLPESVLRAVESDAEYPERDPASLRRSFVLLDNESALNAAAAAARRRGFTTEIAKGISDQPIEAGCSELLRRLKTLCHETMKRQPTKTNAVCLISGGEFACPVKGEGLGGRNLETALRLATGENLPASFIALCAGTDGIDGNSPAAGAIVDHTTVARARSIGLDPSDFIQRSDAYSFFVALGDVVATGPTGTNVRDLRILLAIA